MASGSFTISITGNAVTETDGRSVCHVLDESCMENVVVDDPSGSHNCTYDGDPSSVTNGTQHCFTCYETTNVGDYTVNYTYDAITTGGCGSGGNGDPHITKFDGEQYELD